MIAKLIVEGKEFDIEIHDPKLQELVAPKKKTGYERINNGKPYYLENDCGVKMWFDQDDALANANYAVANYYSNKAVAENNARADRLMRQLRRFAVEHRTNKIDWCNQNQHKYFISYDRWDKTIDIEYETQWQAFGVIYFDSLESAELAMKTFNDELFWYFNEYKDSL